MNLLAENRRLRLALGIMLACVSGPLWAQTTGPISIQSLFLNQATNAHGGDWLEANAGLLYTDNVTLTPQGSGDGIALIGLAGNTERLNAPRLDYHLNSDIALARYFKGQYDTQPYGYLDGYGEFKIVPGTFSWIARDTFNQAILNPVEPATPDNLEGINNFSTGPRFTIKPTLRTTVVLDGTYSYIDSSSKSPDFVNIDSQRLGADLRIDRAFTNTTSAYLTGSYYKVEFKDKVNNTDFDYASGLAGLRFGNARTIFDVAVGYNKAHLNGTPTVTTYPIPRPRLLGDTVIEAAAIAAATTTTPEENPSGSTWQANISRLISPTQRVAIHGLKQVSDAANLFRINLDQPVPGNGQSHLATGQPLTHREYGATWTFDNTRTTLSVNGLYYSDHYSLTPTSDHEAWQLNSLYARQLTPSLNWDLGLLYSHDSYGFGSQHTWNGLTSLRWRVGPKVGLRFFYAHVQVSPNGYTNNQVGVVASYALTEGAKAQDNVMHPNAAASQPYN
jgi:hypothetical protein